MDLKLRFLFIFVIISILTYDIIADKSYASLCLLPAEVGPCRARMLRYAYNSTSGQCEQFVYGGCEGNANNFKTISECEETCKNG